MATELATVEWNEQSQAVAGVAFGLGQDDRRHREAATAAEEQVVSIAAFFAYAVTFEDVIVGWQVIPFKVLAEEPSSWAAATVAKPKVIFETDAFTFSTGSVQLAECRNRIKPEVLAESAQVAATVTTIATTVTMAKFVTAAAIIAEEQADAITATDMVIALEVAA